MINLKFIGLFIKILIYNILLSYVKIFTLVLLLIKIIQLVKKKFVEVIIHLPKNCNPTKFIKINKFKIFKMQKEKTMKLLMFL